MGFLSEQRLTVCGTLEEALGASEILIAVIPRKGASSTATIPLAFTVQRVVGRLHRVLLNAARTNPIHDASQI